jgi:hypothetical protein
MKRILLVAGVGLSLSMFTLAMSPVKTVQAGDYSTYAQDTTPKRDTSKPGKKPKPDSLQIMQNFNK